MKKIMKINKRLKTLYKTINILHFLSGVWLISSCVPGAVGIVPNNNNASTIEPIPPASAREVILFCGNPGVGKSSLCNSIFQQNIFESGISVGQGMTQEKQEYIYENRKYIDTPGLADINLRKQAAEEIEKALKENSNYKIIFVATLEAGRIRSDDLITINTVCGAIKTPFDYGIIFNKVTNGVIREIGENGEHLKSYLTTLSKQPLLTVIIKKDGDMEDARNIYLSSEAANRSKLVNFIANLKANRIEDNQVEAIDVRAYAKKVEEMELKVTQLTEELRKAAEDREKSKKKISALSSKTNDQELILQKQTTQLTTIGSQLHRTQQDNNRLQGSIATLTSQVWQTQQQNLSLQGSLQAKAEEALKNARAHWGPGCGELIYRGDVVIFRVACGDSVGHGRATCFNCYQNKNKAGCRQDVIYTGGPIISLKYCGDTYGHGRCYCLGHL